MRLNASWDNRRYNSPGDPFLDSNLANQSDVSFVPARDNSKTCRGHPWDTQLVYISDFFAN